MSARAVANDGAMRTTRSRMRRSVRGAGIGRESDGEGPR